MLRPAALCTGPWVAVAMHLGSIMHMHAMYAMYGKGRWPCRLAHDFAAAASYNSTSIPVQGSRGYDTRATRHDYRMAKCLPLVQRRSCECSSAFPEACWLAAAFKLRVADVDADVVRNPKQQTYAAESHRWLQRTANPHSRTPA